MPRPFTRAQALQNRFFLAALSRTGNARAAALELKVHRSTYMKRRARCPAFAAEWDSALVCAHAAFQRAGGAQPPDPRPRSRSARPPLRTEGGEPVIVRLKNGRFQLRRALPGRITKAGEQAFFRALSASANVRLSAAAAGFAHSSFYARRSKSRPFAREMRLALAEGYDRLEAAALAAGLPESHADDCWRHNDRPPIPPLTADQALQLLSLHEKSVRQSWDQPHRRPRRGEPWEAYTARLSAMWTAEKAREAEEAAVRRACWAEEDDPPARGAARWLEEPVPDLPPLDQVTGWSKAKGKPPHNPDRAMFGGWRLGDIGKRGRGG